MKKRIRICLWGFRYTLLIPRYLQAFISYLEAWMPCCSRFWLIAESCSMTKNVASVAMRVYYSWLFEFLFPRSLLQWRTEASWCWTDRIAEMRCQILSEHCHIRNLEWIAEAEASSILFDLDLPENLRALVLERLQLTDIGSLQFDRETVLGKFHDYLLALADELKDDPLIVSILDLIGSAG